MDISHIINWYPLVLFDVLQVNGVAQLHSDILTSDLFADYVSIWPTKFQNKTNGITPRRWLRFCNPELSDIITKWLKTDEWVTNLDLLVNLRQVSNIIFVFLKPPLEQLNFNIWCWTTYFLSTVCWQWGPPIWVGVCQNGKQKALSTIYTRNNGCKHRPK